MMSTVKSTCYSYRGPDISSQHMRKFTAPCNSRFRDLIHSFDLLRHPYACEHANPTEINEDKSFIYLQPFIFWTYGICLSVIDICCMWPFLVVSICLLLERRSHINEKSCREGSLAPEISDPNRWNHSLYRHLDLTWDLHWCGCSDPAKYLTSSPQSILACPLLQANPTYYVLKQISDRNESWMD